MKRRITTLIIALIPLFPAVLTAHEIDPDWKAGLQSYLDRAADALKVPGAAVVVVSGDGRSTILIHGLRCADGEDPVTPQTSFGIASLTKAFTATAAAALVGDGVVDWDTRVRELIPELELPDPVVAERVTLRDLLSHRSGLADHYPLLANIDAAPAWILPRLAFVEPVGELRERYFYSSLGYSLAGEMIGRAAGSTWSEVVSVRLLEPLEMNSTAIGPPSDGTDEAACGYHHWKGSMTFIDPIALGAAAPGNGLYSTADDMASWLEFLVGNGEVGGRQIVDAAALQETWTPQIVTKSSVPELRGYGLGWHVMSGRGRRYLIHDGGGLGFTSEVRIFPAEGVAIAVLSNVAACALPNMIAERASDLALGDEVGEDLIDLAVRMTSKINELHAAPGVALLESADPDAPPLLEISDYAGCYNNPAFGRFEVQTEGGAVSADFHGMDVAVEHLHDDVFMLSSPFMGDLAATFTIKDGSASSVSMPLGSPQRVRVFVRDVSSSAEVSTRSEP